MDFDSIERMKALGVKRYVDPEMGVEIEFFEEQPKVEPMPLDPVSLSKTLTDAMPPDSAMLFAATEEIPEPKE